MKEVVYIWKPVGLTPVDAVKIFKKENSVYLNETISYAERLDPMAEGVLILLIGEENKNRDKYLRLNKVYESEIVFGLSTDSYDGLGKITSTNFKKVSKIEIQNSLKNFMGKRNQEYPSFSSKTVNGKPLFWWARQNKLDEIKIPSRKVEIFSIDLLELKNIPVQELADSLIYRIKKVNGDFRQGEIIKDWRKFREKNNDINLLKIKIKVSCSSGTYIRSIANELGEILKIPAFAYSIKRVSIEEISEKDCIRLEA